MIKDLGPIIQGDKSILDHDLTHATSGLSLYPAFDTGFSEGAVVIAPERVTVTRHSGGSHSGWSFYAIGESKLRYYVTHLNWNRTPVDRVVEKGGRLGTVGNFVGARVPHAHCGINVELLLGTGKQLKHNTNYTHGQPIIREQLSAFLGEEDEMTKERILELEAAALKYIATGEGPGQLSEAENTIYYGFRRMYGKGLATASEDVKALLAKIAAAVAALQ